MLTIKLTRRGKKKQPSYRLIVVDKRKDPWGDFKEDVGFYNPRTKEIGLKTERIKYWLEKGAQTTPTVYNLLVKEKIITGKKIKIKIKKKKENSTEEKTPQTENKS